MNLHREAAKDMLAEAEVAAQIATARATLALAEEVKELTKTLRPAINLLTPHQPGHETTQHAHAQPPPGPAPWCPGCEHYLHIGERCDRPTGDDECQCLWGAK